MVKLSDARLNAVFGALADPTRRAMVTRLARGPAQLDAISDAAATEPTPSEQAITDDETALVWQSLEEIPEAYREALVLFYREDHSIDAVAEALDLTQDAVKQRLPPAELS